eukprot:TRINITY_DN1445_c0_g1_i2.p1 TRINITY_DN1445_c0_g1~~TRINITY_DN1445_c0_g1_i2.p1  ORF type:complete len:1454 (-),score=310.78 TRINITY_DN1445_c0_g1_i2:10-3903(-)
MAPQKMQQLDVSQTTFIAPPQNSNFRDNNQVRSQARSPPEPFPESWNFPSLRDCVDEYLMGASSNLSSVQQSQYAIEAGRVLEAPVIETAPFEYLYQPSQNVKGLSTAPLPTNLIEKEIDKLEELYNASIIPYHEYCDRRSELEAAKAHSSVVTIPHTDYSFSRGDDSFEDTSRNIRLFVSSTFRDMGDEREVLMKKVLPRLRALCKERGVFITSVDLRWGITSEQTDEGTTIDICMNEIDRCRPYFLCLLGNRYGWSQPLNGDGEVMLGADKLLQKTHEHSSLKYPWIKRYADRSVTELEVRHAVLNDSQSQTALNSIFFLRGSMTSTNVDPRLIKLKQEIMNDGFLNTNYYARASDLEQALYESLLAQIDIDFPAEAAPTPLQKERSAHQAFQDSRSRVYIGRQYYFDTINSHLSASDGRPIVVIGASGRGKSAFVCNWTKRYQRSHPSALCIAHYIGSTAASSDLGRMLQRIMNEIKEFYHLTQEVPQDFREVVDAFPRYLNEASHRGGMVLILDALNQLDEKNNAHDLKWLPRTLPDGIKLVVSTLPGTCDKIARQRGWKTMEIQALSQSERRTLVVEYMQIYGKTLTENYLEMIISAPQCENALFLRTLLEEIRVFGQFENLESKLSHYLTARTPPQLFALSFQRLTDDFGGLRKNLLKDVLSLLWVSRKGLTENELQEILSLPSAIWSPLFIAMSESIVSKSGYLTFFHDYMRQATKAMYLSSKRDVDQAREKLIAYFSTVADDSRKLEEVPYQLENCGKFSELSMFITTLSHFRELYKGESKFDLYRYWRLASEKNLSPSKRLFQSLPLNGASPSSPHPAKDLSIVASFLEDIGSYSDAETCAVAALNMAVSSKNKRLAANKRVKVGYIYRLAGKYAKAQPYYKEALKYMENDPEQDQRKLASAINSLAILSRLQGNYEKAEPLYEKALSIRRSLFGRVHEDVAESLNSLGCLNQDMGRYSISENYLLEAIEQRESLCGVGHPDVAMSLLNLGGLYLDWSKYSSAEVPYTRALTIYKSVYGESHPYVAKSLHSLAGLAQEMGEFDKAESLYRDTLKMRTTLLGADHPDLALTFNDYAVLLSRQEKLPEAIKVYEIARDIRKKVLGVRHPDYAQSLKNIASLYQDMKQYDRALPLFKEGLAITEQVFGPRHQDVATSLSNLAGLLQLQGKFGEASGHYERSLDILISLLGKDHADVALTLNDMAVLRYRQSKFSEAENLYLRALATYEKVFGETHHNVGDAAINVGLFYLSQQDMVNARKYFGKGKTVYLAVFGPTHEKMKRINTLEPRFA